MLFELGKVVYSKEIKEHLKSKKLNKYLIEHFDYNLQSEIDLCLSRHKKGDWGDVSKADNNANNYAVKKGGRIISSYMIIDQPMWIITEPDRKHTDILYRKEFAKKMSSCVRWY